MNCITQFIHKYFSHSGHAHKKHTRRLTWTITALILFKVRTNKSFDNVINCYQKLIMLRIAWYMNAVQRPHFEFDGFFSVSKITKTFLTDENFQPSGLCTIKKRIMRTHCTPCGILSQKNLYRLIRKLFQLNVIFLLIAFRYPSQ